MKKLMFAAAIMAAGVAMATESDVVGYQIAPLQFGYNIFAPTFDGVGSKSLNIQDLKLQGVPGEGTDLIWVLNAEGMATGDTYLWLDAAMTGTTSYWTLDGESPLDLDIVAGEGFYVYTEAEGASVMVSGQVKIGPYSKDLQFGYNLTGNFSPVAMDIQNIKLEGVPGEGTDLIWVLNAEGMATGDTYLWLDASMTGTTSFWTLDGETPLELQIQPGEGMYLYTESEEGKIVLPPAIPAK